MATTQARQGTHERPGMIFGAKFLVVLVLLALIAVAGIWVFLEPKYRAEAFVLVESPLPKAPMQLGEPLIPLDMMDRFVAEQAQLVRDDEVLRSTIEDSGVRETRWFRQQPDESAALEALRRDLSVDQVPATSYLRVSFTTIEPQGAARVVNTVVEKYLAKVEAMSRDRYSTELQNYERRANELDKQLQRIRDERQEFIEANIQSPGVMEGLNVVAETLRQLAPEVTRLEAEKSRFKAAYENLIGSEKSKIEISPQMRAMIQQDPQLAQLRDKKLSLELEYQANLPETADSKTALDRLQRQIEWVERKVVERLAQRENEVREYQIDSARTLYHNAVQAELELRERLLDLEAKQRDLDRALAQYRNLEEEQLRLEDQLARVRDHIGQLQMMIKDRGMVRVRLIGQAYPPTEPDLSGRVVMTGIAVGVPVLFGILLLVFRLIARRTSPGAMVG